MKMLLKIVFLLLVILVVLFIIAQIYNRFFTSSIAGGLVEGKFAPCSPKPNCVSSMSTNPEKYIAPIGEGVVDQAQWESFLEKTSTLKRVNLITQSENYAHFVFSSLVMGYIDDVEFLYNFERGVIEVRSASRVGHSDFGVNRQRIEKLRVLIQ